MRRLYLHIGIHKTGTSSIQYYLSNQEQELNKHNLSFVTVGNSTNLGDCVSFHKDHQGKAHFGFYPNMYEKLIDEISSGNEDKIISSEDLYFIDDELVLTKFHHDLNLIFDDIVIIVYLRNQVELAKSNKAQGAKTTQSSLVFGCDHMSPLPLVDLNVESYLNYYERLKMWKRIFSDSRMIVSEYDRDKLVDGDSVTDFIQKCNLPLVPQKISSNESLGSIATNTLLELRKRGVEPNICWDMYRKGKFEDVGGIKEQISKNEAEEFFANFSDCNRLLNRDYGIELSLDPEKYGSQTVVQEIDNDYLLTTLVNIMNELGFLYEDSYADLFRDAALSLEERNINVSKRLMELAKFIRPDGPLINSKIQQYEMKMAGENGNAHATR